MLAFQAVLSKTGAQRKTKGGGQGLVPQLYRVAQKNRSLQSGSKRSLFIDQSLQKFVSIRSSLFLRHLQNIKFELAKLIAFQPLQSVLQMSSTALLADFNAAVEVLNDSLACITWDCLNCRRNCCFEVRDGLWVVCIHSVL